jgi:prevent-host-death family protein
MIYVGVRDLKAKLSEYLDKAKLGNEIIVTDHGKPIARLIKEPVKQKSTIEKMYILAEKGLVQLPSKEKHSKSYSLIKTKSKITATELLLKDR